MATREKCVGLGLHHRPRGKSAQRPQPITISHFRDIATPWHARTVSRTDERQRLEAEGGCAKARQDMQASNQERLRLRAAIIQTPSTPIKQGSKSHPSAANSSRHRRKGNPSSTEHTSTVRLPKAVPRPSRKRMRIAKRR